MVIAMLELLLTTQLGIAVGVALVMVLRLPTRRWVGPRLAFSLWLLPLLIAGALIAPGPFKMADTGVPVIVPDRPEAQIEASETLDTAPLAQPIEPVAHAEQARFDLLSWLSSMPEQVWLVVWILGALGMATLLGVRQARFYRALHPMRPAPEFGEGVFRAGSSAIGASLVGVTRPKIIVPADFETRFEPTERQLIVEHEREHRRSGHALFNAVAAVLQALCWMNPAVHLAQRWFRLDQELACDAAVLGRVQNSPRTYGAALLRAQTDMAAPFGCTWRPSNGLATRIGALGQRAPRGLKRGVGVAVLLVTGFGLAAASWAARPEIQRIELSDAAGNLAGDAITSMLDRVEVRGIDARLTLIVEPRSDIALEGYPGNVTTQVRDGVQRVQLGEADGELCNTTGAPSDTVTIRIPEGLAIDLEGRMQARLHGAGPVVLRATGCGTIQLDAEVESLNADLGGSIILRGEAVSGDMIGRGSAGSRILLEEVGGTLAVNTAGGSVVRVESLLSGGRAALSGGSELHVESWRGTLDASLGGSSEVRVTQINAAYADVSVSGSSRGWINGGRVEDMRVDQAASAQLYFGGAATRSHVRNRGDEPVVLTEPGALDGQGLIATTLDPPAD